MKKNYKIIFTILMSSLILIIAFIVWYFTKNEKEEIVRNVDQERSQVIEMVEQQLEDAGYEYEYQFEKEYGNGVYDVRLYDSGKKLQFYYTVNVDTKEVIFHMETLPNKENENQREEGL